jgi:hypothetical protein
MDIFNPPNPRDFPEREKEMFISDKVFELMCCFVKAEKLSLVDCTKKYNIKNLSDSVKEIYNLN